MAGQDLKSSIASEMQVEEAVGLVAATPRILWAFAFGYVIVTWRMGPDYLLDWPGLASALLFLILMFLAQRWIKMRNRPRPTRVSNRLLKAIVAPALIFGLAWAAFISLMLIDVSPVDQIVLLLLAFFAAINTVSIGFYTALFFSLPSLMVIWIASVWSGALEWDLALGLFSVSLVIIFQGIMNRRNLTISNIKLSLENREALAALSDEKTRTDALNASLSRVSTQLGKYISPQLYDQITTGAQEARVVSQRKKLTVFFSDVASFTEITDQLEPEDMTAILNRYLTEMADIAQAYGANFDKFMGDGIIVYFGDPETLGTREDASACVKMAIAMQRRMEELNLEWMQEGLPRPLEVRMGINTGYVTVGNFGSDDRLDYTIIGGEVNLASRLEFHADLGGILLSHPTYMLVQDWVEVEESQPIQIRGFARPVKTYRLRRPYDAASDGATASGEVIHRSGPGIKLTIDTDRVRREDRDGALQSLRAARDALDAAIEDL
ncbi:MAG: adenylate/guanylate cyclase domain-containing protein [Pseudomonadota bacterium]